MDHVINGYSAEQLRAAESPHIAAGVPLMARAAAGLAREIRKLLPASGGRVVLLVGSGNNGGDTLYAGADLAARGADVAIVTTGNRVHDNALAAALVAGAHREAADSVAGLAADADVVVDGLLGTGTSANPALRGTAREIVAAVLPVVTAARRPLVVAADIPSGINPNDGSVPDPVALRADVTVTFGGYKAGLLLAPARELAGRVVLIDIGLGPDLEKFEPLVRVPQ